MAQLISFSDFVNQQDFFVTEALQNKIFIYPTDTIYGIGAIATDANKAKINWIKQRPTDKILSVISPNLERVHTHYPHPNISELANQSRVNDFLNQHHGVTFIFDPYFFGGVRFIRHAFQRFVTALGHPFITTSVNPSGHPNCHTADEIHSDILEYVDYIIDDGKLDGTESILVNLISGEVQDRGKIIK